MRQALRSKAPQRQQISTVVSYPAPLGGWNARDPLAAMKPMDAVVLNNWFPRTSYCEIRGGYTPNASSATGMTGNGKTLMVYNKLTGSNQMFGVTASGIYNVSSAGTVANYLNLPGASGDYSSTPDSTALDITGDIEIIAYIAPDDWTPAAQNEIVAKFTSTGNQRSYAFFLDSIGTLGAAWSVDGIATLQEVSTASVSAANGIGLWVRMTLDVNDGAGNRVTRFYTSTNPVTTAVGSVAWTQLGATVTTAGVTSIFASTAILEIGSINAGNNLNFYGKINNAYVYNGIGGTLAASFRAEDRVNSTTVISGLTGETYTANGTATFITLNLLSRTNGKHQWTMFGDGTNNWLIACNGVDKPAYYDGTTWTAVDGVTSPALTGVTSSTLVQPLMFKGRLMFIQVDTLKFWYLASGAAGGALTAFDLSGEFKRGGYLQAIGSWTRDAGDGQDDVFVAVSSEGEAVVYQGTNPSAANTWAKVGSFYIGKPLGRRCLAQFGGDLIVLTENGAFPLSAAMQSAVIDYKLALSFKIENAFTDAARTYGSVFGWKTTIFPAYGAMIVNVPISEDGEHQQYVMNTITKSWCKFTDWDAEDFAVFNGELYFTTSNKVVKAWTGMIDGVDNIEAYGKQAFNYFGKSGQQKRFTLYRPVLAVNGSISFLTDIDVDFQDMEISGSATYSVTSGAQWDASNWDEGYWAAGLEVVKNWTSPDSNVGYCASGKIRIATNSLTVQWIANDITYEGGGIL